MRNKPNALNPWALTPPTTPSSQLDEHNAIVALINRYSLLVSQGMDNELREFYAPGAVFDGLARFSIDDEFDHYLAYLKSLRAGAFPNLRQFLATSAVSIKGNSAEAYTPVLLIATPSDEGAKVMRSGVLHDRLVKTSSGWRFAKRTAIIDGA